MCVTTTISRRRRPLFLSAGLVCCLVSTASLAAARGEVSTADYPSLQAAIDANPGGAIVVSAGDHSIDKPVVINTNGTVLTGFGRILQTNNDAAIVQIENASDVILRDLTLARAADASLIVVKRLEKTTFSRISGNYIENAAQSMDVHSDKSIRSENTVNRGMTSMKAMHGSRYGIIARKIFSHVASWGINIITNSEDGLRLRKSEAEIRVVISNSDTLLRSS